MNSLRKWFYRPRKDDPSLMAQFFYSDEALNLTAAELDSFNGRKDPERCSTLVNQLRQCQDRVLNICLEIMDEMIPDERAPRDFRVKFPDDVIQENLAGQLWFGAECLAAGSSILNRETESSRMRPLAKAVTKIIETVRNLLREQCLKPVPEPTEKIRESLKIFDKLFAEFELSYVSAMVHVKTIEEHEIQQNVVVLFSETLQRALKLQLITQEQVDNYDPALMFTIPRLAIVAGLVIFLDGPLNLDKAPKSLSELFRPFRALLTKIRELLWTMTASELAALEKSLCSMEEPGINAKADPESVPSIPASAYGPAAYTSEFVQKFYANYPSCQTFTPELGSYSTEKKNEKRDRKRDRSSKISRSSRVRQARLNEKCLAKLTDIEERPRTSRKRSRRSDHAYREPNSHRGELVNADIDNHGHPRASQLGGHHSTDDREEARRRTRKAHPPRSHGHKSERRSSKSIKEIKCSCGSNTENYPCQSESCDYTSPNYSETHHHAHKPHTETNRFYANRRRYSVSAQPEASHHSIDQQMYMSDPRGYTGMNQHSTNQQAMYSMAEDIILNGDNPRLYREEDGVFLLDTEQRGSGPRNEVEYYTNHAHTFTTNCDNLYSSNQDDNLVNETNSNEQIYNNACALSSDYTNQPSNATLNANSNIECLVNQYSTLDINETTRCENCGGSSRECCCDLPRATSPDYFADHSYVEATPPASPHSSKTPKGTDKDQSTSQNDCDTSLGDELSAPISDETKDVQELEPTECLKQSAQKSDSGQLTQETPVDEEKVVGCSSGSTSPHHSGPEDDEEVALALQAFEVAATWRARARFRDSQDLIQRLFVCISGVADQLQTNYPSDLRKILKWVFIVNQTPIEEEPTIEDKCTKDEEYITEQFHNDNISSGNDSERLSVESAEDALTVIGTPEMDQPSSSDLLRSVQDHENDPITDHDHDQYHDPLPDHDQYHHPIPDQDHDHHNHDPLEEHEIPPSIPVPPSVFFDHSLMQFAEVPAGSSSMATDVSDMPQSMGALGVIPEAPFIPEIYTEQSSYPNSPSDLASQYLPNSPPNPLLSPNYFQSGGAYSIPDQSLQQSYTNPTSESTLENIYGLPVTSSYQIPISEPLLATTASPTSNSLALNLPLTSSASNIPTTSSISPSLSSPSTPTSSISSPVSTIPSILPSSNIQDASPSESSGRRRPLLQEPPAWLPDHEASRCMACGAAFTLIRRRHHCRNCGKVFCGHCSQHSVPLPHYGIWKAVRVCNCCFLHYLTYSTESSQPGS